LRGPSSEDISLTTGEFDLLRTFAVEVGEGACLA